MKSYGSVLTEKSAQVTVPTANTLHRSSLLFSARPFETAFPVLTLSNHFKIKRGIDAVGMRIWGFDQGGKRLFSDHRLLTEPRVYRYDLKAHCEQYPQLATCQVEFYSGANLGMPYPAVIVNHTGEGFHNSVHAYARVLNDVFEDEEINEVQVDESSIDVRVDELWDTFVSFLAGPFRLADATIDLEVRRPGGEVSRARMPVNGERFSTTTVRLSEAFPGAHFPFGSVLKVKTPRQSLFFGRMMGGLVSRGDRSFSANHTYYDHGGTLEYLDAPYGYNFYPLIPGLITKLVFYPIQAPSRLQLTTELFDERGGLLGPGPSAVLDSPNGDAAVLDLSAHVPSGARSYRIIAKPCADSKLPARISHQIVVGQHGHLEGSISESLEFPMAQTANAPAGRPYMSWIQGVHGNRKITKIGLTAMRAEQTSPASVKYTVYDERGLVSENTVIIPPNGSAVIESQRLFGEAEGEDRYFFVYTNCETSRIKMISVVQCQDSGHCSAEHNF